MFTTGLKEIVINSQDAYDVRNEGNLMTIVSYSSFDVTKVTQWKAERYAPAIGDVLGITFPNASELGINDTDEGEVIEKSVSFTIGIGSFREQAEFARDYKTFGKYVDFSLNVTSEDTAEDIRTKFIKTYRAEMPMMKPYFDMYKQGTDDLILYTNRPETYFQSINGMKTPIIITVEGDRKNGNSKYIPTKATIPVDEKFGTIGRYTGAQLEESAAMGTLENTDPYKIGASVVPDVRGKYMRIFIESPGSTGSFKGHPHLGPVTAINTVNSESLAEYAMYILENSSASSFAKTILDELNSKASSKGEMVLSDGSITSTVDEFINAPTGEDFDPSVLGSPALEGYVIL